MVGWVCSAQHASICCALGDWTYPTLWTPLHLWSLGEFFPEWWSECLEVCGKYVLGLCVHIPFGKKSVSWMFSPHGLRSSRGSNRGGDSEWGHPHVNEDIVWLSLIKMFPQGCRIHGLKKNVIADVIKRCVMIHDNNYAAGKTTAHDLLNVQEIRESQSLISLQTNQGKPESCVWIEIWVQLLMIQLIIYEHMAHQCGALTFI